MIETERNGRTFTKPPGQWTRGRGSPGPKNESLSAFLAKRTSRSRVDLTNETGRRDIKVLFRPRESELKTGQYTSAIYMRTHRFSDRFLHMRPGSRPCLSPVTLHASYGSDWHLSYHLPPSVEFDALENLVHWDWPGMRERGGNGTLDTVQRWPIGSND